MKALYCTVLYSSVVEAIAICTVDLPKLPFTRRAEIVLVGKECL